jgi:hypothetical protein
MVSVSQIAVSRAFTSSERRPRRLASGVKVAGLAVVTKPVTHACGVPELAGMLNGGFGVGNVVGDFAEEFGLTTTKTR